MRRGRGQPIIMQTQHCQIGQSRQPLPQTCAVSIPHAVIRKIDRYQEVTGHSGMFEKFFRDSGLRGWFEGVLEQGCGGEL